MKANLALEYIGATNWDRLRRFDAMMARAGVHIAPEDRVQAGPHVAEIRLGEDGNLHPHWLQGKRDYTKANSKGTRGVYLHFVLEQDRLYWVQEPVSWRKTARYFAAVTAKGDVVELSEEEASEWQKAL